MAGRFGSVITAMVTPFRQDHSLDLDGAQDLARWLLAHFGAVAESTSLPVILYNIPGRTACVIEPDTLLRLARDVPNIVAVKDATADFVTASRVVQEAPPGFELYSGNDWDTFVL